MVHSQHFPSSVLGTPATISLYCKSHPCLTLNKNSYQQPRQEHDGEEMQHQEPIPMAQPPCGRGAVSQQGCQSPLPQKTENSNSGSSLHLSGALEIRVQSLGPSLWSPGTPRAPILQDPRVSEKTFASSWLLTQAYLQSS